MSQKIGITMSTVLTFILLLPLSLNKTIKVEAESESEPPSHEVIKTSVRLSDEPKFIESNSIAIVEPVAPVVEEPKVQTAPKQSTPVKPQTKNIAANTTIVAQTYDQEYIKKRICEVWGPAQCANAIKIAQLESGLRTHVKSPTNDFGVMQVNCTAHAKKVGGDCTKLYDLETNLRVAKQIYDGSRGWSPWTTSKMLASH